MRVYLDANVILYIVEGTPAAQAASQAWIESLTTEAGSALLTSALSHLECRIKHKKAGSEQDLRAIDAFLGRVELAAIDIACLDLAATIRAGTQHRTPDAIHLATATLGNADVFLTADRRLKSYRTLRVVDVLRDRP
ncbi:MAG: PIN domain-containing protein [Vicinamibacteria bacterium]